MKILALHRNISTGASLPFVVIAALFLLSFPPVDMSYASDAKQVTVATSFDGEYVVSYEKAVNDESSAHTYIAHAPTGKRLAKLDDFGIDTVTAEWHPNDTYLIIRWRGERYMGESILLRRVGSGEEAVFTKVELGDSMLKGVLRRDADLNLDSQFAYIPQEWERTNLIVGIIALEREGNRPHPFAQDEVWYEARIAIRENEKIEPVALWRTHGSKSGHIELVWEK